MRKKKEKEMKEKWRKKVESDEGRRLKEVGRREGGRKKAMQ